MVQAEPGQADLKIVMGRAGPDRAENFEKMMDRAGPGRATSKMRWVGPDRRFCDVNNHFVSSSSSRAWIEIYAGEVSTLAGEGRDDDRSRRSKL